MYSRVSYVPGYGFRWPIPCLGKFLTCYFGEYEFVAFGDLWVKES